MNRNIVVGMIVALNPLLSACAPPGYVYDTWGFVPHARNACLRPEINEGFLTGLNTIVGTKKGPPNNVVSIQGLDSEDSYINDGTGRALSCRGTLILSNGQSVTGTVGADVDDGQIAQRIIHASEAIPSRVKPIQYYWTSDAELLKQEEDMAAIRRAHDWRSFKGNIDAWSGIPPLPASASSEETPKSNVNCTVSDVTGNSVQIWASSKDCDKWIRQAAELSKKGPTSAQYESYKIDKCIQALSARAAPQSYSGQFYGICAGVGAHY